MADSGLSVAPAPVWPVYRSFLPTNDQARISSFRKNLHVGMGTRTYGIACGGELKPFPTFNVSTTWLFSPSMPNHFTAEQFAASEALGELRTQIRRR